MAHIKTRGSRVRAQVMVDGERHSKTHSTKAEAKKWAASLESQRGEVMARGGATLAKALEKYAQDVSPGKRGSRWEEIRLKKLAKDLKCANKRIRDIKPPDIVEWRDQRLKQVSAASVLREMNLLSAVFRKAVKEWGWAAVNPCRLISRPATPKPRSRKVSDAERDALVAALGYTGGKPTTKSQRVAIAFLLALQTAMRSGEIAGIKPDQVFLEQAYVHLPVTKNGHSRNVPLSKDAIELLKLVDCDFRVSPVDIDVLFRKARDRLAKSNPRIAEIHFHDSRRTGTTRLSKVLPPMELASMTGHLDLKMIMRVYYSPDPSDIALKLG